MTLPDRKPEMNLEQPPEDLIPDQVEELNPQAVHTFISRGIRRYRSLRPSTGEQLNTWGQEAVRKADQAALTLREVGLNLAETFLVQSAGTEVEAAIDGDKVLQIFNEQNSAGRRHKTISQLTELVRQFPYLAETLDMIIERVEGLSPEEIASRSNEIIEILTPNASSKKVNHAFGTMASAVQNPKNALKEYANRKTKNKKKKRVAGPPLFTKEEKDTLAKGLEQIQQLPMTAALMDVCAGWVKFIEFSQDHSDQVEQRLHEHMARSGKNTTRFKDTAANELNPLIAQILTHELQLESTLHDINSANTATNTLRKGWEVLPEGDDYDLVAKQLKESGSNMAVLDNGWTKYIKDRLAARKIINALQNYADQTPRRDDKRRQLLQSAELALDLASQGHSGFIFGLDAIALLLTTYENLVTSGLSSALQEERADQEDQFKEMLEMLRAQSRQFREGRKSVATLKEFEKNAAKNQLEAGNL